MDRFAADLTAELNAKMRKSSENNTLIALNLIAEMKNIGKKQSEAFETFEKLKVPKRVRL
jgi:hypothetical protein